MHESPGIITGEAALACLKSMAECMCADTHYRFGRISDLYLEVTLSPGVFANSVPDPDPVNALLVDAGNPIIDVADGGSLERNAHYVPNTGLRGENVVSKECFPSCVRVRCRCTLHR
jgi:hypothetical protein